MCKACLGVVCVRVRERHLCPWTVLFLFLLAIIFVSLQVVAVAIFYYLSEYERRTCTELVDRRARVGGAGHRCWLIILFNELKSEHCVRCTYI